MEGVRRDGLMHGRLLVDVIDGLKWVVRLQAAGKDEVGLVGVDGRVRKDRDERGLKVVAVFSSGFRS